MLYQKNYFSALLENLNTRGERAVQGLLGLGNLQLRQFIHECLNNTDGTTSGLLADPVFEPTFGWEESNQTMQSLAGGSLLHADLARVMATPPKSLFDDYAFPKDRHPFKHQLSAWEILNKPEKQSLVVTSGTGSGKTECFLVPVLNQLAKEIDAGESLEGVRALFVYPLNALINSQQNRLDAWTDGFNGKIRHCLYTGALEKERPARCREYQGQVIDRKTLRESPPQILVTNATMLEYMLIRKEDAPILDKSSGKLRWIILDEAHTHIGSQAAEMALLLRRTMLAFNVKAQDVRFIATSATFGSDEKTIESLRNFLADIGGITPEQVHVVQGYRTVPILKKITPNSTLDTPEAIFQIESDKEISALRYQHLENSPVARQLRDIFTPENQTKPRSLKELARITGLNRSNLLAWLDVMSGTKNEEQLTFLPLRAHIFHNVISTMRACVDAKCAHKSETALAHENWPFGMVYFEDRTRCNCGAPLMPIVSCTECNETLLKAAINGSQLIDPSIKLLDEFVLDDKSDDEDIEEKGSSGNSNQEIIITGRFVKDSYPETLSRENHKFGFSIPKEQAIELNVFHSTQIDECPCCGSKSNSSSLFRYAQIGAPSTLSTVISTALEFCPTDANPTDKPFQGRKLISFTDSRQGTARIAVKVQQDAEHNRVRGLIYRHLLRSKPKQILTNEELIDLKELRLLKEENSLSPRDERNLARLEKDYALSIGNAELNAETMVSFLSETKEFQQWILYYYTSISTEIQDSTSLANRLLAREFFRRPKRAKSLETLGLVQITYPKLKQITSTPMGWPSDLASWQDYLKNLLDFFVRQQTAIDIPKIWLNLFGLKIRTRSIIAPTNDNSPKEKLGDIYITHWPSISNKAQQSRAVLLLCKAFKWSTEENRDKIDSILRDAWEALVHKAGLLTSFDNGYKIVLKDFSFKVPESVYLCPITRRFIDTPFMGLSPYTPRTDRNMEVKVTPYKIPHPPEELLHISGEKGIIAIRDWANNQPEIQQLRQENLWSDISDTIIEGGNYFRCAEHSAQQPKSKLDRYEKEFKENKLNLLSCSTTMEMGVDIGGINTVAMNNVPPHPANYLQRAGRAGRRREGRAVAVTVCKNTPHDQAVFNNPLWAFNTPMHMPKVSLQSPDLVQRHINAWLLSYWLKQEIKAEQIKSMTSGAFFLKENGELSLSEIFISWCNHRSFEINNVKEAVHEITRRSVLASISQRKLFQNTFESLEKIKNDWSKDYEIIEAQRKRINDKKSAAYRALDAQLKRIEGEYLLSELADQRFLPGYGFPTDIVSFDNSHIKDFKIKKESREDNRARYRDLASRDRITGLREYSPGSELVMDGLVYKSAGITLNWHAPASEEGIKELQLFKKAWRCSHCGSSGTTHNPDLNLDCDYCGLPIESKHTSKYIVPAGFAVDFYGEEPHNDITHLDYIPVEKPWLNIPSNWIYLANSRIGQFRTSQRAELFHYSSGRNSKGFAICLECGRAEPMLSSPDLDKDVPSNEKYLPITFRSKNTHKRLRGGKSDDPENKGNICSGSNNSWKIQQSIHLGHDSLTDALELILRNPNNGEWLNDRITSYSIAVALREAIAAELGIQSEELGCDSQEIKINNSKSHAIRVFDLRSGGYTTQAATLINERSLWERVIKRLDSCGCKQSCQRCLLSFDTRFDADNLNRHKALEWINKEWLYSLAIPEEMKVFGQNTQAEITTLHEAIEHELNKDDQTKEISFYFSAPAEDWDLADARQLRQQILAWENAGHTVSLHLTNSTFNALAEDQKESLARFSANNVQIFIHEKDFKLNAQLNLNASIQGPKFNIAWASDSQKIIAPQRTWDINQAEFTLVKGPADALSKGRLITTTQLAIQKNPAPNLIKVELNHELNGSIDEFAKRFLEYLKEKTGNFKLLSDVLSGEEQISDITYTDRYVCNPFTINLLANIIYELGANTKETFAVTIKGRRYEKEDNRSPWLIWHDWLRSEDRDEAMRQSLNYCGFNAKVISEEKLPHYRQLCLELKSGRILTIQLDQGFSYWRVYRNPSEKSNHLHKFDFGATDIGEEIMGKKSYNIEAPADDSTQIFIYSNN